MSCSPVLPLRRTGRTGDRRLFVVEFVGTPGSGKTTLSLALLSLLQEHGIDAASLVGGAREHARRTRLGRIVEHVPGERVKSFLLWQVFYVLALAHARKFASEHRVLVRWVFRTQLRRPITLRRKIHILAWFVHLVGRYRFVTETAREGETLVLDDGFLHRAIALHASHVEQPDPDAVAAYVDLLPWPDVVVFTLAGRDVCEQRVHRRGVWQHSRKLSSADVSRYLMNAEWVADLAVHRAHERGWTVVGVDNGGRPLDRVERDLTRALAHCLSSAPSKNEAGEHG